MKTLFNSLSNTYKVFKLLSNPKVGELLNGQLQKEIAKSQVKQIEDITFYHGHYFVQVMN